MTNSELSKIFAENSILIFRFLRLRTFSKEVAEDLTSETFLRFVANKDVINNSDQASRKSYLYGIAKLVFMEYLRKKYQQEISIDFDAPEFQNYVEQYVHENSGLEKRTEALHRLIPSLPKKQRQVISLRLIEKKSTAEIVEILNKDSNYVRTTQKRGIVNLRKLWECTQLNTGILELTHDE